MQNIIYNLLTIEINQIILIKSLLIIVQKIKKILDRKIIFLLDIVFRQNRAKISIIFEVQNIVKILKFFVIFNNNRFTRFLILFRQRISNNITNKNCIENKINFYKYRKLKFDN